MSLMSSQWFIVAFKKFALFFLVVNEMDKYKIDRKIIKNMKEKKQINE